MAFWWWCLVVVILVAAFFIWKRSKFLALNVGCVGIALAVYLFVYGSDGHAAPPPDKGGKGKGAGGAPAAPVEWNPEMLREKYFVNNAARHGWLAAVPDAETVMMTYKLRSVTDTDGPVQDSGLNTALMKGGDLKIVASTLNLYGYYHQAYVQIGEQGEWYRIQEEVEWPIQSSLGAIRIKIASKGGADTELPITFRVTEPAGQRVLIPTRQTGLAARRLMKPWGKLPSSRDYDWRVYIRYTGADGSSLLKGYLLSTPGKLLVRDEKTRKKRFESSATVNEVFLSSRNIATEEDDALFIGTPQRDESYTVEVRLLILPKGQDE